MRLSIISLSERSCWLLLLVFTLLVRGAVLWGMFGKLEDDPDSYRELAENLAREGTYGLGAVGRPILPTAFRPPLYPIVLSSLLDSTWQLSMVRVVLLHLALGTATVLLTLQIGLKLKLGNASYFAALMVACDPILLNQSALIMTETLATFLAVLSLWCLIRWTQSPEWWKGLLAGGALGLAVLCRPVFLPWVGLSLLALLVLGPVKWLPRLGHAATLMVGVGIFLVPWGVRNSLEIGKFTVTTTHGGFTFFLGNNEKFYDLLNSTESFEEFHLPGPLGCYLVPTRSTPLLNENVGWHDRHDEQWYEAAWLDIRKQPGMFVYSCFFRIYQLFNPLPHRVNENEGSARQFTRYSVAVWYLAIYLFAALGCLRWWRSFCTLPWLWGVLLCVTFVAVHTFYWTNIRMRAPLMPFLCLVAAAGTLPLREPSLAQEACTRKP